MNKDGKNKDQQYFDLSVGVTIVVSIIVSALTTLFLISCT
ncbi:hypothetical protein I580_01861 [Enterococcus caccae ATCC BAA-1240]|uniref:Uncharacterized protein n=1 Tax=Enterococcus caccae ATCC BAA-1240 TaxID=1158612 RepID=R3TXA4_9ENTE|nr:hypothetical protein UC7_01560 [Enterococcus caccae ATCC BAA-1240]EOT60959.1 hypothetical protein I580_01861 [Enterococcus caccae ATCC BAA-1240]